MAVGYIDPKTGKYVKGAGNYSAGATEEATEEKSGLMSAYDKRKVDKCLTTDDSLTESQIEAIFKK